MSALPTPSTPVRLQPGFRPEAVVFDLDGLLVDSEDAWGRAERAVVEGLGCPWDPAVRTLLLGRGPADAAAVLAEFLDLHDPDEIGRRLLAAAEAEFRRGVPLLPGAGRLVAGLRGRLPLGVATNSLRRLAELAIASVALEGVFDAIVCADDVERPKPAPDLYTTACALLGADPARSVAFEDSPVGMRAARAAGLWVVGCPSFPGQPTDAAHAVIGSLREVDPGELLAAG
ncbi:MAG: HAD family phosphatase [Euzebyales bacterium]|nr:HAD family phosphatase [Euzebyales bacterium]